MHLFWFGVLCGGVTMFLTTILIAAQAIDEKEKEIKYLRKRLKEQAEKANI